MGAVVILLIIATVNNSRCHGYLNQNYRETVSIIDNILFTKSATSRTLVAVLLF